MNTIKVNAARKCLKTLQDDQDWEMWLMDHPNEERGLNRLLDALESNPVQNDQNYIVETKNPVVHDLILYRHTADQD